MIHSPAWPDSDLTAARPSGRNLHTSDASTTGISVGSSTSIASGWLTGPVDPSGMSVIAAPGVWSHTKLINYSTYISDLIKRLFLDSRADGVHANGAYQFSMGVSVV